MESLDNILESITPKLEPKQKLSATVLAALARNRRRLRMIRLSLVAVIGLTLAGIVITLLRGNAISVINAGLSHASLVTRHVSLYFRALLEVIPVVPCIVVILGAIMVWRLRRAERSASWIVRRFVALTGVIGLLGVSSATFAATTANHVQGPAQQQLQRSLDDLGQPTVTIDGKTYEIGATGNQLSDTQLQAQAESDRLNDEVKAIPQYDMSPDGGNAACLCKVVSMSSTNLVLDFYQSYPGELPYRPSTLTITAQTAFFHGASRTSPFLIAPGTLITAAASPDDVHLAYISQLSYPYADYLYTPGFSSVLPRHNANGRCYNYELAQCPNMTHAQDLIGYIPVGAEVPPRASIREVFGVVQSYHGVTIKLQDSTGSIWTFVVNPTDIPAGETGIVPGAGLRVEFWQLNTDFSSRTVIDQLGQIYETYGNLTATQVQPLIRTGIYPLSPLDPIRSLDLIPQRP